MDEDELAWCIHCQGSGYDPDQSNLSYEQLVNVDPRTCSDCWCGRIYPDEDF